MESATPALLICAHGSSSEGWAEGIREFAAHVRQSPGVEAAFSSVEVAYLERNRPDIPSATRRLLAGGAPRVIVVPLFLTASTHLSEDLPGLLGLPVPEHVRRRLVGEGHTPLTEGLPVEILDLGPLARVLAANVERRLSLRAADPAHEAVVLCAYGSSVHHAQWETLLGEVRLLLMQHGFAYAGHAFVGHVVGMSPEPTAQAIAKAGQMAGVRRVHVVPLLMSRGSLQTVLIATAVQTVEATTPDFRVVYEPDAILPDGDLAAHVAALALRALGMFVAADRGASA